MEAGDVFASAGTTTVRAVNKGSDTGHCAIGVMSERCLSSRSNVTSDGSGCAHSCQEVDQKVGKGQSVIIQCYTGAALSARVRFRHARTHARTLASHSDSSTKTELFSVIEPEHKYAAPHSWKM